MCVTTTNYHNKNDDSSLQNGWQTQTGATTVLKQKWNGWDAADGKHITSSSEKSAVTKVSKIFKRYPGATRCDKGEDCPGWKDGMADKDLKLPPKPKKQSEAKVILMNECEAFKAKRNKAQAEYAKLKADYANSAEPNKLEELMTALNSTIEKCELDALEALNKWWLA